MAGAMFGVVATLVGSAAFNIHAEDPKTDVEQAAAAAGVDPVQLQGALNSLETAGVADPDPYAYLRAEGLLEHASTAGPSRPPPVAASPPAPAAVSARVECIISKESGGANVANRRGSGAVGVLQYMPSTFAAHAAEIGHPEYSPWNPAQARAVAAHDLALGRRGQWTVGGC